MTKITISEAEVAECLNSLWEGAFKNNYIDTLCTLLRVSGMQSSGWDSFKEAEEAFEDFNWYLKVQSKKLSEKSSWRIGLLMYCHACEMSAVHATLKNLLSISLNKPFQAYPFIKLVRSKGLFKGIPPSAKTKWKEIGSLARSAMKPELVDLIDCVFNDEVRNAFSHSDYVITDDEFRWTEAFPGSISLQQLSNLISNSFVFFGAFMAVHKKWLNSASKVPRFCPLENYEVLELVKSDGSLDGFKVHFSNGNHAEFRRTEHGVIANNLIFDSDGTIGFQVGDLDGLTNYYVVEGVRVQFQNRGWVDYLCTEVTAQ